MEFYFKSLPGVYHYLFIGTVSLQQFINFIVFRFASFFVKPLQNFLYHYMQKYHVHFMSRILENFAKIRRKKCCIFAIFNPVLFHFISKTTEFKKLCQSVKDYSYNSLCVLHLKKVKRLCAAHNLSADFFASFSLIT